MVPHYFETGTPAAPALVLAHSLATDSAMWDGVLPSLESRFRVIRYDARGHGRTPPPDGWLTMDNLVQDVVDLMDHLGLAQAHIAGLSMGGMVGMGLALAHPGRVLRLAVCDARADAPDGYKTAWDDRIATVERDGFAALITPTVARWFTPQFLEDADRVSAMQAIVARTTDAGYIGCARALQGLDYKRHLPTMAVPTLFLVGDADVGASPDEMRAMHDLTPHASFVLIGGAGHISAVEQPETVGRALADFFERVLDAGFSY